MSLSYISISISDVLAVDQEIFIIQSHIMNIHSKTSSQDDDDVKKKVQKWNKKNPRVTEKK